VERLRQWVFGTTRGEYNLGTFLYNLSIVGETTADLLTRFPPEIEARQAGDLIVFAAGLNDAQSRQRPAAGDARGRLHERPGAHSVCPGVGFYPMLGRAHAGG
jgi:hypothetical protein